MISSLGKMHLLFEVIFCEVFIKSLEHKTVNMCLKDEDIFLHLHCGWNGLYVENECKASELPPRVTASTLSCNFDWILST